MALNIVFDEFGFLESNSDVVSKLSSMHKQPPISPIESESSSGISSLDSDDLKKQLTFSSPTISSSHDQDDEEQQSNDGDIQLNEKEDENDNLEESEEDNIIETELIPNVISPVKVIYQNRNILNLVDNIWSSGRFIQYTVLPDNNLSCFFQNRAQYWRLGSSNGSENNDTLEKCSCCDFCYPSIYHQQLSQNKLHTTKNAITDSLLTFLKINHVDFNNTMPNSNDINNINSKNISNNSNIIGNNKQRMYNNNTAFQTIQQQQQQFQNSGYHQSSMNGFNPQINAFNNNGYSCFNNSKNFANAALNMMNQPRNVITAFQQTMNNNSRYQKSNINNNNGLYKQF
ncbi:uncharacterized protein DDB_G0287625-like [Chironomus tepperi]|uniref:uncharacterized protein DDB_G0287625-like n=1 Tax=Chironomus tepperi TaxID=113505 RepID=UPI00391FA4DA